MTNRRLYFWAPVLVVAIITVATNEPVSALDADGLCPLLTLLPFSNQEAQIVPPREGNKNTDSKEKPLTRWPESLLHQFSYSYMAAAQLAMDHFNARDPCVVPDLADLGTCTVQFPYQVVVDSGWQDSKSIMGVLSAHHEKIKEQFLNTNNARQRRSLLPGGLSDHSDHDQCPSLVEFAFDNLLPPWCAVLGPKGDRSVTQTSALTGALDIPQLIFDPVGHMALAEDVPTTIGLSLPSLGRAKAIISYLQRPQLVRNYLAILHSPLPVISDIVKALKSINRREYGLKILSKESQRSKPDGVKWLKETGITTILLGLHDPQEIRTYAELLEEEGMLGDDFMYLFLEEGVSLDGVSDIFGEIEPGSPLDKLLSGGAVISQTDKFSGVQEDSFQKVWHSQNASFVQYLNELTPKDDATGQPLFQATPTFFQDQQPAAMVSFIYDAVISVGLGACQHQELQGGPEPPLLQQPPIPDQMVPLQGEGLPPLFEQGQEQGEPSLSNVQSDQAEQGQQQFPQQAMQPTQAEQQLQLIQQYQQQHLQGQVPPLLPGPTSLPTVEASSAPEEDEDDEGGGTTFVIISPGPTFFPTSEASPPPEEDEEEGGTTFVIISPGPTFFPTGEASPPHEEGQQEEQGQGQGYTQPPQWQQGQEEEEEEVSELGHPPEGQGVLQLTQEQTSQQEGLLLGPPPGTLRHLESNPELGLMPTVDRLFAKIQAALYSMQSHDNTTAFVSRVHVTYNDTHGYPQRILIVYDIPRSNSSDPQPRSYNEFTFFATITNVESLQQGPNFGTETPAPSIEDSTTFTSHSELQHSQEVFIRAQSLWDSHNLMDYQFDYDLFFDMRKTDASRQATPYPWKVVVEDLSVARVTDAKGRILVLPASPSLDDFNSSGNISSYRNETTDSILNTTDAHVPLDNFNFLSNFSSHSNKTTDSMLNTTDAHVPALVAANMTTPNRTDNEFNTTLIPEPDNTTLPQLGNSSASITSNVTVAENQTIYQPQEDPTEDSPPINANHSNASQTTPPPLQVTDSANHQGAKPGLIGIQNGGGKEGPRLVDSILQANFDGASGRVSFQYDLRKSRDLSGILVGAYNIRPSAVNKSTGLRSHSAYLTSYALLTNNTMLDVWMSVPNEEFVYRDGSKVAPTVLRRIEDQNFLSEWVHVVGLALFASAFFLAMLAAICIWHFSNYQLMEGQSAFFMYLLCLGSAFMSGAIFTLSWDESYGWSIQQLDVACALTPWLFFVGHLLIFTSLYCRVGRVNQAMQLGAGQTLRVMGPLVMFLLLACSVLAVWTIFDPWNWERTLIQERPAETYGECFSSHAIFWFVLLTTLVVLGEVTTAAIAWKTADVPLGFSDESSVFYASFMQLQAWFIGIPILIALGNDSVEVTYFGRVLLIWFFSVSAVSLVVVPMVAKVVQAQRDRVDVSSIPDSMCETSKSCGKGADDSTACSF